MGNRPWPIPRSLPVCPDPARIIPCRANPRARSEEHTSELQSQSNLVCRLLLEKKKKNVLVVLLDLFLIMLPRLGWMPDVSASYTRHIVKYFSRRVHMLFEDMLWVERTALVRVD